MRTKAFSSGRRGFRTISSMRSGRCATFRVVRDIRGYRASRRGRGPSGGGEARAAGDRAAEAAVLERLPREMDRRHGHRRAVPRRRAGACGRDRRGVAEDFGGGLRRGAERGDVRGLRDFVHAQLHAQPMHNAYASRMHRAGPRGAGRDPGRPSADPPGAAVRGEPPRRRVARQRAPCRGLAGRGGGASPGSGSPRRSIRKSPAAARSGPASSGCRPSASTCRCGSTASPGSS